MQSLHFMFGTGSLIAPLIAVPFLANTDEDGDTGSINETMTITSTNSNLIELEKEIFYPEQVRLVYPYTILAIVSALSAAFTLLIWFYEPETTGHPSRLPDLSNHHEPVPQEEVETNHVQLEVAVVPGEGESKQVDQEEEEEGNNHRQTRSYKCYKVLTILLVMLFMHTYLGLEISFGSYLTTFVVKSGLPLTKSDGAHITTTFWATFTLFRVLTVFYIEYVRTEANILASLVIILLANCFLVPFGDTSVPFLLTGVCLIGIGTSSVWASLFGYMEEFFPVTSFIGSLIVISAVTGEFVFPYVISNFIDHYPRILIWVTLFCSVSTSLLFLLIMLLCRVKLKRL